MIVETTSQASGRYEYRISESFVPPLTVTVPFSISSNLFRGVSDSSRNGQRYNSGSMQLPVPETRKSVLRKLHLIVGIVGIVVFLGTGQYMRLVYDGLRGVEPLPRMLFRSAHIYLLLSSLINVALGLYLSRSSTRGRKILQTIASTFILFSPPLMLTAFFVEPGLASFHRPFAGPGIYALFSGMLLHLIAGFRKSDLHERI